MQERDGVGYGDEGGGGELEDYCFNILLLVMGFHFW